jgi:hypothetical protein
MLSKSVRKKNHKNLPMNNKIYPLSVPEFNQNVQNYRSVLKFNRNIPVYLSVFKFNQNIHLYPNVPKLNENI